jgi:hypothetical protein
MRIIEITRPENRNDATSYLRKFGYHNMASEPGHERGHYSTVLYKPNMPYVLKLFTPRDTAYLSYLKLITSVSNPHFPVIRGKPTKVNDRYYAVRLEHLTLLTGHREIELREQAATCLTYLSILDKEKDPKIQLEYQAKVINSARHLPRTLVTAIDLINIHCIKGQSVVTDLHEENVMMRGNTMVIIDPIQPNRRY